MKTKYRHIALVLGWLFVASITQAQNIDIGSVGKGKPFKISGGLTANSVFYNSSQESSREAFTYFLQGNLNIGFYQFSLPISYSYSNQGSQLELGRAHV